jgi:solute carrier family 25 carnitine/acylcarnitine transporter 20/29
MGADIVSWRHGRVRATHSSWYSGRSSNLSFVLCCSVAYWVTAYPLDIIKSAIQTDSIWPEARKYSGWSDAASKLWKEGGVKRYTAGLAPALLRSFPANAAGFALYEATKKALEPEPQHLA